MKSLFILLITIFLSRFTYSQTDVTKNYLDDIKKEMNQKWPDNKTINIVFHGHSVPSGYFNTPIVRPFDSYPHLLIQNLKEKYPYAVINSIVTAIGGENAIKGEKRFKEEVLCYKPDILFIDYALNDRWDDFNQVRIAWQNMIESALQFGCKVILMTPTPDNQENITDPNAKLQLHTNMIIELSEKYKVGVVDSYAIFKQKVNNGDDINNFLSQSNHPNKNGHQVVANLIFQYF